MTKIRKKMPSFQVLHINYLHKYFNYLKNTEGPIYQGI
jgi:hypothetical protein